MITDARSVLRHWDRPIGRSASAEWPLVTPVRCTPLSRPPRLAATEGALGLPGPSGPVRIPDRRVIAQARGAFEVLLDNRETRRLGAC
jgi:hypothetical protein